MSGLHLARAKKAARKWAPEFRAYLQSDEVETLQMGHTKILRPPVAKGSITWEAFNNGIAQRDFLIELMRVVESAEA